jgi:hypothetical protein
MRVPEEEEKSIEGLKSDTKKKPKRVEKKKEVKEETEKKPEAKPVPVTLYEVSLSDFFKSLETSFEYDKLFYDLEILKDTEFEAELKEWKKLKEAKEKGKIKDNQTDYSQIKEELLKLNTKESEYQLKKYAYILENYTDEKSAPPVPEEVLNAFCVKLYFVEQAFESRSIDFLMQAFDLFPNRDYLILTQPHSYFENTLLSSFIKVEKKNDSLFSDMLYIVNRESLMTSLIKFKYSDNNDLLKSAYLFENFGKNEDKYYSMALNSITDKTSKFICITVKINLNNIGIFLVSKEVNIAYYDSHFNIRDFSNLDKINKYFHGRIIFFAIHKNFKQHTKLFIKELARLTNKISLYYEISPDINEAPGFIKEMLITRNRRFPHFIMKKWDFTKEFFEDEKIRSRTDGEENYEFDEEESENCLVMTTKKMFADSRIANNNRIVVVGGSDTGISFIESLLSIRYLEFSNIYLIAPGGLLYHHIENEITNLKVSVNNYQINELKKLLFEHRIKIIDSKVLDIKPNQKYIQLEDNSILFYDYLILALGLQDKLWVDLKNVVHKQLDEKFEELKELNINDKNQKDLLNLNNQLVNLKQQMKVISIDDTKFFQIFSPTEKIMSSLRKNPKFEIILYGRSLNLYCFIQGLLKRKIPAHKIKLIIPNIYAHSIPQAYKDEKATNLQKKDENFQKEISFTNSSQLENCPEVEEYLNASLEKIGIKILNNFNFEEVILNETNDAIISYKFKEEGNDRFEEVSANLIVTGGLIDVDQSVFKFIHENKLVYNGRSIIDRNFLTSDQSIFSAGRLCEFSQRYKYIEKGKPLRLEW